MASAKADEALIKPMSNTSLQSTGGEGDKKQYDVFISYQWDHQDLIKTLAEKLKAEGLAVWLDLENMAGDLIDAMANGIDSSRVVIVCMSEEYQNSTNCGREAKYAFHREKPVIPLKVQRKYRPSGWLGLLVGSQLYVKTVDDETLESNWEKIIKELERHGVKTITGEKLKPEEGATKGCDGSTPKVSQTTSTKSKGVQENPGTTLWRFPGWESGKGNALEGWSSSGFNFGRNNVKVLTCPGVSEPCLEVTYPAGSYSSNFKKTGARVGGCAFFARPFTPTEEATLSYQLQFEPNFDFVKNGKLPGLFGGTENNLSDFSARIVWRSGGYGEVCAFIPEEQVSNFGKKPEVDISYKFGHSIGRGCIRFIPGQWHTISQYIKMNTPGKLDGEMKLYLDGSLGVHLQDLNIRGTDSAIAVDGVSFSTFFGGTDKTHATPEDTSVTFGGFILQSGDSPYAF